MMAKNWQRLVATAPTRTYQRTSANKAKLLARYVPKTSFDKGTPPDFLYTSGNLNRCNPAGVMCAYFGEGVETARAEFDSYRSTSVVELGFYARVKFKAILDFENPATCDHFELTERDFTRPYMTKSGGLIPLQEIGDAVSCQASVVAIRFPSNAMMKRGRSGFNLVVFQDLVRFPSFLEIVEDTTVLARWPS